MKVVCIVPSAGRGARLKQKKDKAFVMLAGKPILFYTLKALTACSLIDGIVVVASPSSIGACKGLVRREKFKKVFSVVRGGKKRFDSVKNALRRIRRANIVLIHDGVRPFLKPKSIEDTIKAAERFGASVLAVPSKQTVKEVSQAFFVKGTPTRKFLWEAQTPQGFRKNLIDKAYARSKNRNATDDSSLVEKLGYKVKIVKGSYGNIKITTPEDFELAKILLRKERLKA